MEKSFFERIIIRPRTRCWIWTGARYKSGYGQLGLKGKPKQAHRYSYEYFVGDIPAGLCVLHRCDVRSCVNPNHLFVGTKRDNILDCYAKGRHPLPFMNSERKGEKNASAKLTEDDVRAIRASDGSQDSIALRFGVCQRSVSLIKRRLTWTHVK